MKYKYVTIGQYVTISIDCTKCNRVISFGARAKDFQDFLESNDADITLPYVPHYSKMMLTEPICESCTIRSKTNG